MQSPNRQVTKSPNAMRIVTAAEMREIDRLTTEQYGVPSLTLMENAGAAVAEFCLEQYPAAQRVGVICGKGNNGGDGFVAARKLHEAGKSVQVLLLADPAEVKGEAAEMLKRVPVNVVVARTEEELKDDLAHQVFESDLLVDAILGTGFKPPVTGIYAAAIEATRFRDVPVVSVDLPSGLDADSVDSVLPSYPLIYASAVVTFTAPKPVHAFFPMRAVLAQIGTPREASWESSLKLSLATPGQEHGNERAFHRWDDVVHAEPRLAESNKGSFGHVLVVGGSRGKAGAPAMAGLAALRAGAGLCTVATARGVQSLVASFAPELMTEDLAETEAGTISLRAMEYGRIDEIARGKTVVAIGPGISRNPESAELARTLVHRRLAPLVLDADGLNAFEGHGERLDGTGVPLILTPHPGEMARLTGLSVDEVQADRIGVARKFAHDQHCVVVLKGWRTLIAEPSGEVWVNPTGNPGMATGGTGDVLTGIIAGLVAQAPQWEATENNVDAQAVVRRGILEAVITGVYLHGLAGDLAAAELGEHALIATDLLRFLPHAIRRLRELRREKFLWLGTRGLLGVD